MMAIANLLGGSRKSGAPPSQAGCEFLTPYAELITLTSLPGYSELTDQIETDLKDHISI